MIDRPATPPEIAKLLKIKPETIRAFIHRGDLKAVDLRSPGSSRPQWRIMPEHLAEFLERKTAREKIQPTRRRRRKPAKPEKSYY
jgi:excisionase family DNA binding protein